MGQNTLGLSTGREGVAGGFLGRVLFIAVLILLFWSPIWFGTPQHPELQKTLAENHLTFGLSLPDIYVALFQYSYPNRVLEWLLFGTGALAALALLCGVKLSARNHNVTYAGIGWALLMLAVMASGKTCKVPEYRDNWTGALFILYGIFFYVSVVCLNSVRRREVAAGVVCLALLVVAHAGFLQFHGGLERTRELYAQDQGFASFAAYTNDWALSQHDAEATYSYQRLLSNRVSGTFTSPNVLGGYCLTAFLLALGLWRSSRERLLRILGAVAAVAALWLLLYTRSKSVILLAAGLGFLWTALLCGSGKLPKKALWLSLAGAAAYAGLGLLLGYGARLGAKLASTGHARLDYAKVALKMIRQKVVTGYGVNSFARWYKLYAPKGAEPAKFAHNTLLQMWAEFGIAAGLGWLLAFTLPFINGWDRFKASAGRNPLQLSCILAGAGFFLHCLLDFDFYVPGAALTAIAVLAMGYFGDPLEEQPENQNA